MSQPAVGHFCAAWGWLKCREAVMQAAISAFTAGRDAEAVMLRDLVNSSLVIKEQLRDAPMEHCAKGDGCR